MTEVDTFPELPQPVVMSIAGSDSSAGAGIQADLKTFSAMNVYGTSVITCITAQNPYGVRDISAVSPEMVAAQIKAVCETYPIRVVKTGMLYSADIIKVVASEEVREGIPILVVDPVMVATSGARLLQGDAVEALCNELLPLARVVTPNLHEAEILCGHSISSVEELRKAAREIGERYDVACVIKGGALGEAEVVDVLWDEGEEHMFSSPRIQALETHGAGCAFSAALTAYLAKKELMSIAVGMAQDYCYKALSQSRPVGPHHPLNFLCDYQPRPCAPVYE